MSDSDPGILKGTTASGELVAVPAPRPREKHWTSTIPIVAALAVAFSAGAVVRGQAALEGAVNTAAKRLDDYAHAHASDERLKAIEAGQQQEREWRIAHEARMAVQKERMK